MDYDTKEGQFDRISQFVSSEESRNIRDFTDGSGEGLEDFPAGRLRIDPWWWGLGAVVSAGLWYAIFLVS